METTLYKFMFKDGSIFKVFCSNKHQKERVHLMWNKLLKNDGTVKVEVLENGIHDIKQFEDIMNSLKLI